MATIVREGRDPWWTPLAVNILGGLWNDWQQRERNKKEAAYLGELERMRSEMTGNTGLEQGTQPPQDNGQGLLNTSIPEGYNNNGWANAFHKTDTPLAQFDLGTAGLVSTTGNTAPVTPANAWTNALGNSGNPLPQFNAGGTTPTQPQGTNGVPIVTPMDFYNAAMQLAGTKRFGMISPDRIQALLTPYMKANEEAWRQKMRDNVADQYMNATDGAGRVRAVTGSMIRGITPESMANIVFNQNKPTPTQFDLGGQIVYGTTDGMSGMFNENGRFDRTLTPQEIATNAYNNAKLQADIERNRAQMAYNYASLNQQGTAVSHIQTDANGVTWIIRQNGTRERFDGQGLTVQEKAEFESGTKRLSEIDAAISAEETHLSNWQKLLNEATSETDKEVIRQEMARIRETIAEYRRQQTAINNRLGVIANSRNTGGQGQPTTDNNTKLVGTGMDIGANMLGIEKPTITTHFKAPRKKKDGTPYEHAGTDYAMQKDSPIRMADVGTTMRVTRVGHDKGYGNFVEAQGEMTGTDGKKHTISMLWAHMGNGTTNVRKGQEIRYGDLIGKVGNTGNSRGSNGGYHLHLETRIDGKLVDPTKFTRLIAPYIAYSKTNNPNTFTGVTPPPEATVIGRPNGMTVAYRNPRTGREVSQADVEEIERKAKAGKIDTIDPNGNISAQVHEHYLNNGFERATITDNQNTQGHKQPVNGDTFPITEQPTAQRVPTVAPFDYRPSRVQPAASISFTSPTVTPVSADIQPSAITSTIPQQPTASTSIPDPENEAQSKKALAALNGQFNTWDEIYRNRYPAGSMSDFWRV